MTLSVPCEPRAHVLLGGKKLKGILHHSAQFQKVVHNAPHINALIFLSHGAQMPPKRCRQADGTNFIPSTAETGEN